MSVNHPHDPRPRVAGDATTETCAVSLTNSLWIWLAHKYWSLFHCFWIFLLLRYTARNVNKFFCFSDFKELILEFYSVRMMSINSAVIDVDNNFIF